MKREPIAYPPGFFLELVRAHHFPPMYEPLAEREARASTPLETTAAKRLQRMPPPIEVMNRYEAIERGLKRYRAADPCSKGHTPERYTATRHCCECVREHNARIAAGRAEA